MQTKFYSVEQTGNLIPLAERWRDEADKSFGLDMNDVRFKETLMNLAKTGTILVLESDEGRPLGFMGLIMISPLGGGRILSEHFWYIEPEHRRGKNSLAMIEAAEKFGKEHGCTDFCITASRLASAKHDILCNIYKRLGFRHFETTFIKRL